MHNENQPTKVSGSALLEEMRKQTNVLTELNKNILRLMATMQSTKNTAVQPARPVTVPQHNPQQMAAAQQAASMYPSMSGPQHNNVTTPTGDRISGVEEPPWMNQLTPIDRSKI